MPDETDPQSSVGGGEFEEALEQTGAIPPATPPAVATTGVVSPGADEPTGGHKTPRTKPNQTLAGRVWVAIGCAVVILVLLIIFIAENSRDVTIKFLGLNGTLSLALAMIIAALAGVVITLLVGTARILQLRRQVKKLR